MKKITKIKIYILSSFIFIFSVVIALYWSVIENFVEENYIDISNKYGFVLKQINYDQDMKYCIDLQHIKIFDQYYDKPIFSVPITEIRERLTHIDCIQNISIKRILPSKILVKAQSKTPIAIWQTNQKFYFITVDQTVIEIRDTTNLENFIIIVGYNAPAHTHDLLQFLDNDQIIRKYVTSAIWISNRRWNVRFNNGIEVMLPEVNPEIAWHKFVELATKHDLFNNEKIKYKTYDFRIENKLITRP